MQPSKSDWSDTSPGFEDWRSARWPICLETPPEVASCGIGIHGMSGNERYHLKSLWCLHLYPYQAAVSLGRRRFPIRPGFAGIIPPDTPIEYEFRSRVQHLYVHFHCPEPAGETRGAEAAYLPAMQDLGEDFPRFYSQLEDVIRGVGQPSYKVKARVWDILCQLADRTVALHPDLPAMHPAVQQALHQIELRLGEELSVAVLAEEARVSYSYLARLFREAFGTTVVGYIRARRVQRAEHLLRHSTLSVKAIAIAVGIPDLHFFNKTIRRALGRSPRSLRTLSLPQRAAEIDCGEAPHLCSEVSRRHD